MNDRRLWAAFGGFAFVAAWIGFGFGQALLCVLGAVICVLALAIAEGQIDLGELQSRFSGEEDTPAPPSASAPGVSAPPPVAPRARRAGRRPVR